MYPVKVKDLIPGYCEGKEINPEHLDMMVTFQYEYTRDKMESLEWPRIGITGMGIFPFKLWKVKPENLKTFKNSMKAHPENSDTYKNMVLRLKKLSKMRAMIINENERREVVREVLKSGEHVPSISNYGKGCRCDGCRKIKSEKNKKEALEKKNRKKQLNKLKQLGYELERETTKSLG